jgi:hypothetical protein
VVTIILALIIPVVILATGFLTFKSVQLGLRWQIEVRQEKPPTLEVNNPIQPVMEAKQEKEVSNILEEWFNGAEESR